jgi:hypothetical protein
LRAALELENAKQQAQTITPKQRDIIAKTVKGKIDKVCVSFSKGLEPQLFAAQIASAFNEAGLTAYSAPAYDGPLPLSGVMVFSKGMKTLKDALVNPIVGAFIEIGILPGTGDTPPPPLIIPPDAPLILVGEKLPDLGWPLPLPSK